MRAIFSIKLTRAAKPMRGFRKYDLVQTVFLPGRHVCNTLVCYNIIRTVAPFGPAAMKENTPPDGGKHSVVKHVVFLLIVLALACAAAGYFAWRTHGLKRALARAEDKCRNMQKDRAIRQNLQHILDSRGAEIKRLRAELRQREADAREMEDRASELNMTLFQESGRRIIAEREDGVKKIRMDLLDHELQDAKRELAAAQESAAVKQQALQAVIDEQKALIERQAQKIEKLSAAHARRAQRRAMLDTLPDQVTMDELLGTSGEADQEL